MDNINRVQYGKPDVSDRQAPFGAQLGMYWLYFKWQWLRDPHDVHPTLQNVLAAVFFILGLFGGYAHWRYDRRSFWFFGPLIFTVTLGLIFYLNFKYGYSESPELGDRSRARSATATTSTSGASRRGACGSRSGFVFLWEAIAAILGTRAPGNVQDLEERPTKSSWAFTSPILALAFVPLFVNWKSASRAAPDRHARFRQGSARLGRAVRRAGDGRRQRHVPAVVRAGSRGNPQGRRGRQHVAAQHRLVHAADAAAAGLRLRLAGRSRRCTGDTRGRSPTAAVMQMTLAEADAVPLARTSCRGRRSSGNRARISWRRSTRRTCAHGVLERADVFVLHLIARQPRPVGLSEQHVRQLRPTSSASASICSPRDWRARFSRAVPVATKDTIEPRGRGVGGLSSDRWRYGIPSKRPTHSFVAASGWTKPSVNIPALYVMSGYFLAEALGQAGDKAQADSVLRTASEVAQASSLGDLFRPSTPSDASAAAVGIG